MINENVFKLSEFAELQKQEKLATGVAPFDGLTGGLVKGGICEFFGQKGSGKRSVVFAILANMTQENKICAVVDTSNSFDPVSADRCGMCLTKVLWIKCDDDPQKAILATDYLIQSRLFGAVWLDMSLCEKSFLEPHAEFLLVPFQGRFERLGIGAFGDTRRSAAPFSDAAIGVCF